MAKHQLDQLLAEIKFDLQKLYGDRLTDVVLYGSYARGEARSQSDVVL
jgi:predicted nucleotidyltransferase